MDTTDILQQFVSVTGADTDFALSFLETNGWDLEHCINLYLEGNAAQASYRDTHTASPPPLPSDFVDEVRAPIMPKSEVLVAEDPFERHSRRRSSAQGRAPGVFEMFRDFNHEARLIEQNENETTSQKKLKTLADLFRPPTDLIVSGPFDQVKQLALSKRRWMLVNIQDIAEFDCQKLNRDTWADVGLKSYIRDHFVFWQMRHDSEEGERYSRFYPVHGYPHIAIIDSRTGERLNVWEHFVAPAALLLELSKFVDTHSFDDLTPKLLPPSPPRRKGLGDLSEEEQLAAAIAESLKEKSKNTSDDVSPDIIGNGARAHPTPEPMETVDSSKKQEVDITANGKSTSPAPEPEPQGPSLEELQAAHATPSAERNCVIQVRLPTGGTVKGHFQPTDTVKQLHQYVAAHLPPEMRSFSLVMAFPKRVFTGDLLNLSLTQAELAPRAALICERN